MTKTISFSFIINKTPSKKSLSELYEANNWSSSKKIDLLYTALENSDTLVTVYLSDRLVGLANAISDKALVVYFPHLLVHPEFHHLGLGSKLMDVLLEKYADFHQQILVADNTAVDFYKKKGFKKADGNTAMWIYQPSKGME